VIEQSYKSYW